MSFAGSYEPLIAFLLAWTGKVTVLLGLAWIASLALRRRSAALRHRVWAIAIVGSLTLPLASFVLPAWHLVAAPRVAPLAISQTTIVTNVAGPLPVAIAPARRLDTETLVGAALLLWALGIILIAFRLPAGLARLWRISAYSKEAPENVCTALDVLRASFGIQRKVRVLESASATTMPMTWGIFRPTIMLPAGAAEWDDGRRRVVLSHELAHVARNDWPLQICGEAMRACFWFHPLAWIAANQMRQESERACDDAVLNSGIGAPEYASQLLSLAQTLKAPSWRFSLALAVARPSNLERRFTAMLDSSIRRSPLSRGASLAAILFGAGLLLPLAAVTLSAKPLRPAQPPVDSTPVRAMLPNQSSPVRERAQVPGTSNVADEWPAGRGRAASLSATRRALPEPAAEAANDPNREQAQSAASGPVGGISGTVGDPSGARVPYAQITLTDVATGQRQQIGANAAGEFAFSSLIPDNYELSVQQPGFKIYKQTIQLAPSEQLKLPELLLSVGEVTQTVAVSASRSESAGTQVAPPAMAPVSACPASLQTAQPVYTNPAQGSQPGPIRIRVGGNVEMTRLVQQTLPIYPDSARAAGIQGTVVMNAIIGKDGTLLSTCVASGPASLAQSAFNAVNQWRYSPALLNGQPVEVMTEIQVLFTLRN